MRITPSLIALIAATPALAEPKVITDLPPVHSLVAQVMEGVGTPTLLLDQGSSGHNLSLRPSQASAVEAADLVFWIGPAMSPGLEKPFETLGENAHLITLMEAPGTLVIDTEEAEPHIHDGVEAHEGQDHEEDAEEADHEEHAEGGHDGHDHGPEDPHVWLSPDNARTWLALIAQELAEQDPDNATTYQANAEAATAELDTLVGEIEATLAPFEGKEYAVTHRAFAYFEARFHLAPAHALSGIDGGVAGPRAMEELRHAAEEGVTCLLIEPDTSEATVATLTDGTGLVAHTIDPLGRDIAPGPGQYAALLHEIAEAYAACLE